MEFSKMNNIEEWFKQLKTLDLERRVRYALKPPEDIRNYEKKLSKILIGCINEAKKNEQIEIMEDVEKFLNLHDVQAWLTILK